MQSLLKIVSDAAAEEQPPRYVEVPACELCELVKLSGTTDEGLVRTADKFAEFPKSQRPIVVRLEKLRALVSTITKPGGQDSDNG